MKLLLAVLLSGSAGEQPPFDDILYVWAWDSDQQSSDFLAVVDAGSGSVLETETVGLVGGAQHTEHRMPEGEVYFANSFHSGTTFLFNVSRPCAPRIEASFAERGPCRFPHSFERLPNGNVLATFRNRGEGHRETGGLVGLDGRGGYLRGAEAADPDADPDIRPYSLAILPELDRVVTTAADMHGELLARSVQLWRLSDLTLRRTLLLPPGKRGDENLMPAEPRVLADGRSVVVSTFSVPTAESLASLDFSAPLHPKIVQELRLGSDYRPHGIAADADGDRIVVTGRGAMEYRVLLVRFDRESRRMELEKEVPFDRESWPHGETGRATPHGALFYR